MYNTLHILVNRAESTPPGLATGGPVLYIGAQVQEQLRDTERERSLMLLCRFSVEFQQQIHNSEKER